MSVCNITICRNTESASCLDVCLNVGQASFDKQTQSAMANDIRPLNGFDSSQVDSSAKTLDQPDHADKIEKLSHDLALTWMIVPIYVASTARKSGGGQVCSHLPL